MEDYIRVRGKFYEPGSFESWLCEGREEARLTAIVVATVHLKTVHNYAKFQIVAAIKPLYESNQLPIRWYCPLCPYEIASETP